MNGSSADAIVDINVSEKWYGVNLQAHRALPMQMTNTDISSSL
jgi:hypothetical protein